MCPDVSTRQVLLERTPESSLLFLTKLPCAFEAPQRRGKRLLLCSLFSAESPLSRYILDNTDSTVLFCPLII